MSRKCFEVQYTIQYPFEGLFCQENLCVFSFEQDEKALHDEIARSTRQKISSYKRTEVEKFEVYGEKERIQRRIDAAVKNLQKDIPNFSAANVIVPEPMAKQPIELWSVTQRRSFFALPCIYFILSDSAQAAIEGAQVHAPDYFNSYSPVSASIITVS